MSAIPIFIGETYPFLGLNVAYAILQQVISYIGFVSHGPTYGGLPLICYSYMDA